MDNEISQQILKEPRGDSWARKFADAKAFAESYKTNVVVLDKQKFIDELNAQHTNSPTLIKPVRVKNKRSP